MIDIFFGQTCLRHIRRELMLAGEREIGGVLAGEDIGNGQFSIVAASVQRSGGTFLSFVRDPNAHRRFMRRFLVRTGNHPERFNYLGEWHSHPSFEPLPSRTDIHQMQQLIEDPDQIARFLILVILKLGRSGGMEASAHGFRRAHQVLNLPIFGSQSLGIYDKGRGGRDAPFAKAIL